MINIKDRYILQKWECNGFHLNWLRYINRETTNYWISDCQYRLDRDIKNDIYTYSRFGKCAKKYYKKHLKFNEVRVPYKYNPNGKEVITLINNIGEDLKCAYTFQELFECNYNTVLEEDSYTKKMYDSFCNGILKHRENVSIDDIKQLKFWLHEQKYEKVNFFNQEKYQDETYMFLKTLFNVTKIYTISHFEFNQNNNMTKLYSSLTYFHINHFGGYNVKKKSFEDNKHNRTIGFWLFDDILVYFNVSGISTW